MEISVRKLRSGEFELLRRIRLDSLRDSPESFGQTLENCVDEPESYWIEKAQSVTPPSAQVAFIAEVSGNPCGICYLLNDIYDVSGARIAGMWVAPEARGKSIGRFMLSHAESEARLLGKKLIRLCRPEHLEAPMRLYTSAGYKDTGCRKPYPGRSHLFSIDMELHLNTEEGIDR